jgi:hypothetical protein
VDGVSPSARGVGGGCEGRCARRRGHLDDSEPGGTSGEGARRHATGDPGPLVRPGSRAYRAATDEPGKPASSADERPEDRAQRPGTGKLRFVEVKGRIAGAATITVTRNEILYSLNKPDDFILAIVEFTDEHTHRAHYLRRPFQREPDFGVTSVNYDLADLLARAEAPR